MSYALSELVTDSNLDKAGITKNELTQITGLSHTYLSSLKKGTIKKPGRDKIISIATGLNLSLEETDGLLRQQGFKDIAENDAELFIECAKKRAVKGHQPLYDNLNFHLLLISLEYLEGDELVVDDRPSETLQHPAHAIFNDRLRNPNNETHNKLRQAFLAERRRILEITLTNHQIHYLVCESCLKDYMARAERSDEEKEYIRYHFEQLLGFLQHPNYHLNLIDRCPNLRFQVKRLARSGQDDKDKVFFVGRSNIDHNPGREFSRCYANWLFGFATDSTKLVGHFKSEYEHLSQCIIEKYAHPDAMAEHILGLLHERGISIRS